ncbi:MAG: acyl-CoA dehydrogenase [SAR324 cluster bacterium]|uniref:Acyl-CoA dehydrogenase n=1 Tax=SAR324 cluster bacterium TaxID=2024889 RepID=A0A2A4SS35_9DELT|nr:MAG: acyl-CoA dehydrogenase [SAR324 cluster bacterium]
MDFDLTEEHRLVRDSVRQCVEAEIKPKAIETDRNHMIDPKIVQTISELGFLGSYFPDKYSGAELDFLSYIIVVEEISKACASTGVLVSAHTSLGCAPIYMFGTEEQKMKFLPPMLKGEKIGSFLLTEAEAGSDVANMMTTYREDGDYYVLDGSKIFITNGGYRGTGIVFASKDRSLKHKGLSAFILDLETEGVVITGNEEKLGIRGSYTTAFGLDEVRIPKENLLGEEGDGFKIAMETLNGGRIGIAGQALGIAEGAFERSVAYAKERKQFGKPLAALQAIQFKLADMAMKIEAAKLITYKAAWMKDQGQANSLQSAMAKTMASEAATWVTKEAIQVHGGYGYITEFEVERMFRDAKITEIYEGTNEVQRVVISKMVLQ